MDRERPVKEEILAVDVHHTNDIAGGPGVHPSAVLARINEGTKTDARQGARFARPDVAVELGHDTLGEVVCLNPIVDDQPFDAW